METVIDPDVHNMARWGILFQDSPEKFHGHYDPDYDRGNVWNYIDEFGRFSVTEKPFSRWSGGDTPLFWLLWNEYTNDPVNPYMPVQTEPYEHLADWERELLGEYGTIFASVNRQYGNIMEY